MRARENPFRSERLGGLAFRHPTLSLEAIDARWRALGRRAAIVGPHGSGKTTLLRELGERLSDQGLRVHRWFLNATEPAPSTRLLVRQARSLGHCDVLLFDGAGHLSRLAWRRLERASRGASGVLITAHAEGRLPTLLETRTGAALLANLTRELTDLDSDSLETLLAELHAAHEGNFHDVFLALYDLGAHDDPRIATSASPSR